MQLVVWQEMLGRWHSERRAGGAGLCWVEAATPVGWSGGA